MLTPDKHIRLSESIIGLGTFVIQQLVVKPVSIDGVWEAYLTAFEVDEYPAFHSFENLVLAVDFLFLIGSVQISETGKLELCA